MISLAVSNFLGDRSVGARRAKVSSPTAMWLAVVVGFVSTFLLLISLLFAMEDVDLILSTPTGMPYVQLVYNATGSFAGTVCMTFLVLAITVLALIGECSPSTMDLGVELIRLVLRRYHALMQPHRLYGCSRWWDHPPHLVSTLIILCSSMSSASAVSAEHVADSGALAVLPGSPPREECPSVLSYSLALRVESSSAPTSVL